MKAEMFLLIVLFLESLFVASKLYGVNATIIIFVFVLYCIVLYCIVLYCIVLCVSISHKYAFC